MNVLEIVNEINNLSDENEDTNEVVSWINDAMAYINVELGAKFPFFSMDDLEAEPPFPETWQRLLLIPFGVGRTKQKDSSQFEYTDAYVEFLENLANMRTRYQVPVEFLDETVLGNITERTLLDNRPYLYRGW